VLSTVSGETILTASDLCANGIPNFNLLKLTNTSDAGGEGLYMSRSLNSTIYTCSEPADNCVFKKQPELGGDELSVKFFDFVFECADNSTGPLCGACLGSMSRVNGKCERCENQAVGLTMLISALVVLVLVMCYRMLLGWKGKEDKSSALIIRTSFLDFLQLVGTFKDYNYDFPSNLSSFLTVLSGVVNLNVQGLSCITTTSHSVVLPLQVSAVVLLCCGLAVYVVFEWFIIEKLRICRSAKQKEEEEEEEEEGEEQELDQEEEGDDQKEALSLSQYCEEQEYSRSIPRACMFIFSFGSMVIAKASFGTFVCRNVGDQSCAPG
jgi:hypothetical protein